MSEHQAAQMRNFGRKYLTSVQYSTKKDHLGSGYANHPRICFHETRPWL